MSVDFKSLVGKLFHMSGSQAMPSDSTQEYEYENTTEQTFVAPSDGYLTIGSGVSNGSSHCVCWGGIETTVASNEATAVFAPMKKGQTRYFSVTSYRFVRFIPTIGGGLSPILQSGGALCLRLKTILHQSATLLTKDPFHQTKLSTFSLRKQPKLMSRPLMAMLSVLPQISLMLQQSILATGNLLYRLFLATLTHGAVFGSRVKKGILLQLISRVLANRHFDLYSRGMAQANLAKEVCHA